MELNKSRVPTCKSNTESVKCGLCCKKVRDDEDEALFCEGRCNHWFHRYCAGVTATQFSLLSNSEESFLCYACFQQDQRERVKGLEEKVAALTEELTKLRSSRVAATTVATGTNCNEQWSQVAKRGKRGPRSGSGSHHRPSQATTCPPSQEDSSSPSQPSNNQDSTTTTVQTSPPPRNRRIKNKRPCIAVSGARKVWGTLRATTVSAVANAICSVTNIPTADISIKRKFKSRPDDNRVKRWWFVLRGEESTLQNLEGCWNQLELQTKWKLEPVFRYSDDAAECTESDQLKSPTTGIMPNEPATEAVSNETVSTASISPPQEVPITNEVSTLN